MPDPNQPINNSTGQLTEVVKQLLAPGKGLLALDWSTKTITQKFLDVGLTSTPELNRVYRQMLLTTPELSNCISGVIFHDETVKQKLDDGTSFPEYLNQKGIIPGIKVDLGAEKFVSSDEEVTLGLEGLTERLKEYSSLGLKFTKWRAVFKISDTYPTKDFLEENLNRLVEYVKLSIQNDMVPVMEPEVSMKGLHTTTRCAEITFDVLSLLFQKLKNSNIDLTQTILKTNMILPGQDNGIKTAPLEIAEATLRVLRKAVPAELPGIVFLSGGQSPEEAIMNLNEIIKRKADAPWQLSFSYARALQSEALSTWDGKEENIKPAQEVFAKRLEMVSKARNGQL
ncbi:MAG TPA: class I fructose-bisphosphate aldolase [Patescibacteria group bacterium]|nr:class I fructose-bisphosphate aldolase [Patescibacteria group bacterium]